MKRSVVTIILFVLGLISYGQTRLETQKDPFILVIGTAKREVIPDKIFLSIYLTEKDRADKKNINEVETLFIGVLDNMGINKTDLSLSDANSTLIRIPLKGKTITKTKQYQLMVKDVPTLSALLDKLEDVDITNVSVSHVDHSQIDQIKKEVRIEAIKAASDKAEYLLNAIEKKRGDPLEISEYSPFSIEELSGSVRGVNSTIRGARSSSVSETAIVIYDQIAFEKIQVEYSITAKFKIIN